MKKFLLFVAAALLAVGASAQYYMAGDGNASNNWCCGENWNPAGCAMTDGAYSTTVPAGTYQFKVTQGDWVSPNYGYDAVDASKSTPGYEDGGGNVKFTVSAEATINVSFDGSFITLTSNVPFGEATITSWTIAGAEALMGVEWNPAAAENDMAFVGGAYTLTKSGVTLEAGDYDYKACANHAWGIKELPAYGNQTLTIEADGTYDITFSMDAIATELNAQATIATDADEAAADSAVKNQKIIDAVTGERYILKANGEKVNF